MNDKIKVGTMTFFLPFVSARNPQKCELVMMPIDVTPERTPLCWVVNLRSHSATGNTKLIPEILNFIYLRMYNSLTDQNLPSVSNEVAVIIIPDRKIIM